MRARERQTEREREREGNARDKTRRFEWKKEQVGTWNGAKGRKRKGKGRTGHTNESDEDL